MLFNLFKKRKTIALLLDIGSASVGAAFVRIEENKPPHVLLTVREDIPFQGALSSARFLSGVNHSLAQIFKKVQKLKRNDIVPTHIISIFSSPWFLLKVRHIQSTKGEQFEITEELVNSLLDNDIQNLKEELKEKLPLQDIEIIEKKIIQTKLNGYNIQNPYSKKTSHIEIIATVSLSSHRALESIKSTLHNFFRASSLHFSVFPLTAFSAIRDMYPYRQDFIFMDITGEATDISLTNDDLLKGTTFFSYGKNYFIRDISVGLKTPQEEAGTLFGMYLRGELEEKKQTQIENIVMQSRAKWALQFKKVLTELTKTGKLPHAVFFTADIDVSHFFEILIKEVSQDFFFKEGFDVEYLDAKTMTNFVSFESGIERDPFLAIEALFSKKII